MTDAGYQIIYRTKGGPGYPKIGVPSGVRVGDILVFWQDKYLTRIVSGVHRGYVFTHPLRGEDEVATQSDRIYKVVFDDFYKIVRPPPKPEPLKPEPLESEPPKPEPEHPKPEPEPPKPKSKKKSRKKSAPKPDPKPKVVRKSKAVSKPKPKPKPVPSTGVTDMLDFLSEED